MQEQVVPSSPSLTNPDLILPYYASRPRSVSPPARNAFSPSATRSSSVNRVAQPYRQSLTEADEAKAPLGVYTASIVKMARPSLPGAWQTDEDLHRTTDTWTNHTAHVQPASASQVEVDYNNENELHDTVNNRHRKSDGMGFIQEVAIPVENGLRDLALANRTPVLGQSDERPLTVFEEDEVDPFSHAAEILANAKKRLTDMEDNLSRARRSLSVTPSTSKASNGYSLRRHSPPDTMGQDPESWTVSATKNRFVKLPVHTRVVSDTSVPPPVQTLFPQREQDYENQRSSSAMGSIRYGINNVVGDELYSPGPYADGKWGTVTRSISLGGRGLLEPLQEDDYVSSIDSTPALQDDHSAKEASHFESREKPKQVSRARSSLQMRDLHERMQELRGQLTSLKLRTDRDSLHRRSLQTLKTPSPFTVARDWTNTESYSNRPADNTVNGSRGATPIPVFPTKDPSSPITPVGQDKEPPTEARNGLGIISVQPAISHVFGKPSEDHFGVTSAVPARSIYEIASQMSPVSDTFHDSNGGEFESDELVFPVMEESHEDRPDAFDYKNFFVHSGMGTFSRINPERRNSQSSFGSADTTKPMASMIEAPRSIPMASGDRGIVANENYKPRRGNSHSRQNSADSISTVNTFATCTEGGESPNRADLGDLSYKSDGSQQVVRNHRSNGRTSKNKDYATQKGNHLSTSYRPLPSQDQYNPKLQNGASTASRGQSALSALVAAVASNHAVDDRHVELGQDDTILMQHILQRLQSACEKLSTTNGTTESLESSLWRRRLQAAQHVLDGDRDVDGVVF